MIPAAALHTTESFDAIAGFDPAASILAGDFCEFRATLRGVIGAFGAPHDLYLDTGLFKDTWRALSKVVAALECYLFRARRCVGETQSVVRSMRLALGSNGVSH